MNKKNVMNLDFKIVQKFLLRVYEFSIKII